MRKYMLEITAFCAGAIGMIIELVAARILSPYLGSSNLIWTCIIGMMLGFMSLGYYLGGRISDKYSHINVLSIFLLTAAMFTSIIPLMELYVIEPLSLTNLNLEFVAIICSTLTFGLPSLFLATVSPYCVKLKDKDLDEVGKVSGKMSSFSTVGSIVGTFLAGFILIPLLGVKNIILLLVVVLCVLSFLVYDEKNKMYIIKSLFTVVFLVSIVLFGKKVFFDKHSDIILDTDSEYSRIWVRQIDANGNEMYAVQVGLGYESIVTDENRLSSDYLKFYDLFDYYKNDTKDTLMIGGAAYTYPTYYLEKYKDKNIDVVEIDPKMTEIAKEYFKLDTNNERLNIFHEDGRIYLNKADKKYDCILIDAFKGIDAPFQLTTYEAILNTRRLLNDDCIVITNVISSLTGKNAKFIEHEYSTYKAVFENVKVFRAQNGFEDDELQNLILIGFKNGVIEDSNVGDKYKNLLNREVLDFMSSKGVVTDDLCAIGV